jgi:glycosyltransferase involved in cell wall biosynthesis
MEALSEPEFDLNVLARRFKRIRGSMELDPEASVVIPVNAQGDLEKVLSILTDLSSYTGKNPVEIILVINNYAPNEPPPEAEAYRELGIKIISISNAHLPGVVAPLSARMCGVEATVSDVVILFDADCRIPFATDLIDWYIRQFELGAKLAYTHVDYYELDDHWSIQFRIRVHHLARWVKRIPLRIPTTRGSNYTVDRQMMLALFAGGYIADDMNVGRTFKSKGAKIVYSSAPNLNVLTSGRMFSAKGLYQLYRYFKYRLRYNLRTLPVRRDVHKHTGRDGEPARRYVDGKPVTKYSPKEEEAEIG